MTDEFILDPRLGAGPFVVDWPLCHVRFENDARYPWLILVPRRATVSEVFALSEGDQAQFFLELTTASRRMADAVQPTKMNVAMLGNMVPQLHGHVVARYKSDPAWPNPVWGIGDAEPYGEENAAAVAAQMRTVLGDGPKA